MIIEVLSWAAVVVYLVALASAGVLALVLVAMLTPWMVWAMSLLW